MINYLLLIYVAVLLILTFWGCKISPSGCFNESLWNRQQTKLIQVNACLGVILHHLTQEITYYGEINKGPITILSSMGILFTSVFFFCSGYGLIINVLEKPDYLDNFLSHRLPVILVPFYSANIVCILVKLFYRHIPISTSDLIKCLLGYRLLNGNGWYIVEIFFLYIAFYIIFKLIKNKNVGILLLSIAAVFIILMGYKNGHDYSTVGDRWFYGEWWYNSTIVFIMGILFARFKTIIVIFLKKFYRFILPITFVLFIFAFVLEEKIRRAYGYYREGVSIDAVNSKAVTFSAQMILCLISTFLVLLINMKIYIGNKYLEKISVITTELFLIHGIFLNDVLDFARLNEFTGYALVFILSSAAAVVLHYINMPVIKLFQKLEDKKAYLDDCGIDLIREKQQKKVNILKIVIPSIILLLTVLITGFRIYQTRFGDFRKFNKEAEVLKNAKVGDIVSFGKIEQDYSIPGKENINWIVVCKEKDKIMLLSEKGLDGSVYNQHHTEVDWITSDLHSYLNEELYKSIFSRYEKEIIIPNPGCGDNLSLLTEEEALSFFEDDVARQLDITDAAQKNGTNINTRSKANSWDVKGYRSSWWWLRGSEKSITAPIVSVDGKILSDGKYVNKPNGAIRPVIWVIP